MINHRTTARTRWRDNGTQLVAGVVVTGAVIAIGASHAEVPCPVEPLTARVTLLAGLADLLNPVDLLNRAITNFNDATQVLSQVDLSEYPNFTAVIDSQISFQGNTISFLDLLQSAENTILANDPDFNQTLWLYLLNLGWMFNSANILSLTHVVNTGFGIGFPGLVGLANYGLFLANLGSFGQSLLSFPTNIASLQLPPLINPAAALPSAAEDPAAASVGLPTLAPQTGDPFLELVQKVDGSAFTQDADGLYHNNDIIGTLAMQINPDLVSTQGLGGVVESISSQILAGDWASDVPVATDFFKEFVTNVINPNAFVDGVPVNPDSFIETVAYQLDNLLENTVYATDLNDAALLLWP